MNANTFVIFNGPIEIEVLNHWKRKVKANEIRSSSNFNLTESVKLTVTDICAANYH